MMNNPTTRSSSSPIRNHEIRRGNDEHETIGDILESIVALQTLEEKFHIKGGRYCDDNQQHHREKLVEWCFTMVDYFQLPTYLIEWTMNLVDRYCSACNQSSVNIDTTQLKLMTATALRFTIKMDAGQACYSNGQQHLRAMMTIPYIMIKSLSDETKMNETTFTTDVIPKFEMSLLSSLGFHVNPPLTEQYIETFEQVLLLLTPLSLTANIRSRSVSSLLLKDIKIRAISICQAALLKQPELQWHSIPPSCIAFCAYLSALKKLTPVVIPNDDGDHNTNNNWYYTILLDTCKDILLPKTKLGDWNVEELTQKLTDLLNDDGTIIGVTSASPVLINEQPLESENHFCNIEARGNSYPDSQNGSSKVLGKRKESPISTLS